MSSCCVLCYRVDSSDCVPLENKFFQLLARYLNESFGGSGGSSAPKLGKQMAPDQDKNKGGGERWSGSGNLVGFLFEEALSSGMIICRVCRQLMNSFCELYHMLKTTELLLNWQVSKLKSEMESGLKNRERVAVVRDKAKLLATNKLNWKTGDELVLLLLELNELLVKKCSNKLLNSFPVVSLRRKDGLENIYCQSLGTNPTSQLESRTEDTGLEIRNEDVATEGSVPMELQPESTNVIEASINCFLQDGLPTDVNKDLTGSPEHLHSLQSSNPNQISKYESEKEREVTTTAAEERGDSESNDAGEIITVVNNSNLTPADIAVDIRLNIDNCESELASEAIEMDPSGDDSDHNDGCDNFDVVENTCDSEKDGPHENLQQGEKDMGQMEINVEASAPAIPKRNRKAELFNRFRFKCTDCQDVFRHLLDLILHRKKSHLEGQQNKEQDVLRVKVDIIEFPSKAAAELGLVKDSANFSIFATIEIKNAAFPCRSPGCKFVLNSAADRKCHKKLHGKFPCLLCNVEKKYAPNLSLHELKHLRIDDPKYECLRCFQTFETDVEYLQHHLSQHLSLELVEYHCAICETRNPRIRYKSPFEMLMHYKTTHNLRNVKPEEIIKCSVDNCNAYFVNSHSKYLSHLSMKHSIGKDELEKIQKSLNKCDLCGREYLRAKKLIEHRRVAHIAENDHLRFYCQHDGCGKLFEKQSALDRHVRSLHKEGGSKQCSECGKIIHGESQFKAHMTKHNENESGTASEGHGSAFICKTCGKSFRTSWNLKQHLVYHAPKESWEFSCEVCEKKFPLENKLKSHMQVHSAQKDFVCTVCGQKYAHRHNLRIHVNTKHGDVLQDIPRKFDTTNLKRKKITTLEKE